ncbi:NifU family protein [Candidatus Pacearchaeota archaeon]|nr:NifU family protein [Candidatus Pacearchaeota archaeon]
MPLENYLLMNVKERASAVEKFINDVVVPAVQMDGGNIEFIGLEGDKVKVALYGACSSCSMTGATLYRGVQEMLRNEIYENLMVEDATPHPSVGW